MAQHTGMKAMILAVLKEGRGPMTTADIADALLARGYKPGAQSGPFRHRVAGIVSKSPETECVGHGRYRLRGGPLGEPQRTSIEYPASSIPRLHGTAIRLEPGEIERGQRDLITSMVDRDVTEAAAWHLLMARRHLVAYIALKARERER